MDSNASSNTRTINGPHATHEHDVVCSYNLPINHDIISVPPCRSNGSSMAWFIDNNLPLNHDITMLPDLSLPELLQLTLSSSPRPPLRPRDLTWPHLHAPSPRERHRLLLGDTRRSTADDARRAPHLRRPPHCPELERPTAVDRHLVPAATSTNESHDEVFGSLPCRQ
jgi:hypothetical protein